VTSLCCLSAKVHAVAREPEQREDLMRDATALVERTEVVWQSGEPAVVMGRRASGAVSFYFGEDPAYHFTSDGQLRRAYVGGLLYKGEGGRLVEMRRVRIPGELQLQSRVLSSEEQSLFLEKLAGQMEQLLARYDNGDCEVVAEIPAGNAIVSRLMEWAREQLAGTVQVARSPHAG
jgi:hypothetical protein